MAAGAVAGATGVAVEATREGAEATGVVAFMPHSAEVMAAGATAAVVFMARSEDFMDQAPALGVGLTALLRIMAALYI
jgi:hypothetical protein